MPTIGLDDLWTTLHWKLLLIQREAIELTSPKNIKENFHSIIEDFSPYISS